MLYLRCKQYIFTVLAARDSQKGRRIPMDYENVKSQTALDEGKTQLVEIILSMLWKADVSQLQEIKTFVQVYIS